MFFALYDASDVDMQIHIALDIQPKHIFLLYNFKKLPFVVVIPLLESLDKSSGFFAFI